MNETPFAERRGERSERGHWTPESAVSQAAGGIQYRGSKNAAGVAVLTVGRFFNFLTPGGPTMVSSVEYAEIADAVYQIGPGGGNYVVDEFKTALFEEGGWGTTKTKFKGCVYE